MGTATASATATDLLRAGFEEARATYGDLGITAEAAAERTLRLVREGWRAFDLEPTPERIAEALEKAALADLALATACALQRPEAWDALTRVVGRRLERLAVGRGATPHDAESLVQDLLGDLALPATRTKATPLIDTYDGSGTLYGWLSVILVRRLGTRAGQRRHASLEALGPGTATGDVARGHSTPAADPAEVADDGEQAAAFSVALERAWARLSAQERLALLWKHRDGASQRDIGARLGVTESRVSRVVGHAVGVLEEEVGRALPLPGGSSRPWKALAQAVERHWSRIAPGTALPAGTVPTVRTHTGPSEGSHAP